MAIESTPRLGLPIYTSGTDLHPTREDFNDRMGIIEDQVAVVLEGSHDERPAPEIQGRLFLATDSQILFWDTGAEWVRVVRVGNDGPGRALNIAGNGSEGSSDWAARADHVHPLPLATASSPGALSGADKALLNSASANATGNALARRNGSGQMSTAAPTVAGHAANRDYVDQQINTRAPSSHSHAAGDITGTLAVDRIPNLPASKTTSGVFSVDRIPTLPVAKIVGTLPMSQIPTSTTQDASTIMARDSAGRTRVSDPSNNLDASNKRYVDQQRDTRAPSSHTHAASDTSSGTFAPARLPGATQSDQGAMSAADKAKLDGATNLSTANRLVQRDSNGRAEMQDPVTGPQIANRQWVEGAVEDANWSRGQVPDSHVDTILTPGFYIISTTASFVPANGYPVDGGHGSLTVYSGTGTSRAQELIEHTTGRVFYRTRPNGQSAVWTDWVEAATQQYVDEQIQLHTSVELIGYEDLFESLGSGASVDNVRGVRTEIGNGLARVEASFRITGLTVEAGAQRTLLGTVAEPYRPMASIPVHGYGAGNDALTMALQPSGTFELRWISARSQNWNLVFTFSHLVESAG